MLLHTQFISFSTQLGKLHSSGSPCPVDEWTLCLFATFLAARIQHSSIKVYLSGIRAFHIEQGFPDPLANCLRLQRVVCGIKRSQGSSSSSHLPITDDLMLVIWRSLDLRLPDHLMFWAACSLGYFGFLCASEFTVPSLASFSPSSHLGVQDIAEDSPSAPSCMRLKIKASKADPFRKGAFIRIGLGRPPLCAVHSVKSYLAHRGDVQVPCFCSRMGSLSRAPSSRIGFGRSWHQLTSQETSPTTASASGRPLWRHAMEYPTTSCKPWAAGQAPLISSISEPRPSR